MIATALLAYERFEFMLLRYHDLDDEILRV